MKRHLMGTWSILFCVAALAACGSDATTGTPDASMSAPAPDAPLAGTPDATVAGAPDAKPSIDAPPSCDPVAQTGCGPTQACTITASGGTDCEPAGTTATGGGCTTANACVAGDLCAEVAANVSGLCAEFCSTDTDCKEPAAGPAGNTGHCLLGLTGTSFKLCTTPCNPVTAAGATGCPTGLACLYGVDPPTVPELTNCNVAGSVAEGGSCTQAAGCAAGLICVGSTSPGICRQVCRNATDADCTAVPGDTCTPPGSTNPMYGVCCPAGSTTGC